MTKVRLWLGLNIGLLFIMILMGGYTRLTESGLSITEWAPLSGAIPPLTQEAWNQVFLAYQQTPEFQKVNFEMDLAAFQQIYWVEYFHRLWGRLLGIIFFIPLIFFWLRKEFSPFQKKILLITVGLGIGQAFMGWYMVKSGLIDQPRVSHYRLAFHLLVALGIYLLLLRLFFDASSFKKKAPFHLRRFGLLTLALIAMTIFYGGLVAGLRAGLVYNTFPLMEGHFLPPDAWFMNPLWINFFENTTLVQFCHRYLAFFTLIAIFLFLRMAVKYKFFNLYGPRFTVLFAAVCFQFTLGVLTLLHITPLSLALAHQGGALILLLCFMRVWVTLKR